MRVIKFRGLRTDGKGWVIGVPFFIHSERKCFIIDNCQSGKLTQEDSFFDGKEVLYRSVGQFTGLKDKNGKEIYEGDVLTANEYPFQDNGAPNYNAVVEWVFQGFHYVLTCVNTLKRGISEGVNEPLEDAGFFEVIGNIHEKGGHNEKD